MFVWVFFPMDIVWLVLLGVFEILFSWWLIVFQNIRLLVIILRLVYCNFAKRSGY